MVSECCNLVGNFGGNQFTAKGIISISSKGNTAVQLFSDGTNNAISVSPSTGTVSIVGYAGTQTHAGCSGKAGVAINWVTRTDCDSTVYLFGGAGKSYMQGDTGTYVSFPSINGINYKEKGSVNNYNIVDASSASGPAALYTDTTQYDGYGLIYNGNPWSLNTLNESECKINLTSYGIGGTKSYGECLLQNLSLTLNPGQIPTISMDFIYSIAV